tara:strand:- start:76 stop:249 length:174 start_codon:yes stop_codon:yes gene_type:complete
LQTLQRSPKKNKLERKIIGDQSWIQAKKELRVKGLSLISFIGALPKPSHLLAMNVKK